MQMRRFDSDDDMLLPHEQEVMDKIAACIPGKGEPDIEEMLKIINQIEDPELREMVRCVTQMIMGVIDLDEEGWDEDLDDSHRFN